MDMQTALREVASWPVDQRLAFVQTVWDSIADANWHPELSDEQKAEFDRRLAALDANPNDVITWDEIEARLRRQP